MAIVDAVTAAAGRSPPRSRAASVAFGGGPGPGGAAAAPSAAASSTRSDPFAAGGCVHRCGLRWLEWLRARMVLSTARNPYHEMGLNMMAGMRHATRLTERASAPESKSAVTHASVTVASSRAGPPTEVAPGVSVVRATIASNPSALVTHALQLQRRRPPHDQPPHRLLSTPTNRPDDVPTSPGPTFANAFAGSASPVSPSAATGDANGAAAAMPLPAADAGVATPAPATTHAVSSVAGSYSPDRPTHRPSSGVLPWNVHASLPELDVADFVTAHRYASARARAPAIFVRARTCFDTG